MATSKFYRYFQSGGVPLTTATIWLVPQANTYPTGALSLTAHGTRDGIYYRNNVPDGEYKVYIDPAGGSSPSLYEEHLWIGDQRVSSISDHFDETDLYKLKEEGIKGLTVLAGKNLFDKTNLLDDYGIDNLGTIGTYSGWKSARIPVQANTAYAFKHSDNEYVPGAVGLLAYLDSGFSVISTVDMSALAADDSATGKKLTTPSGTVYIFKNIVVLTHNYTDTFQLEEGSACTVYEDYEEKITELFNKKLRDIKFDETIETIQSDIDNLEADLVTLNTEVDGKLTDFLMGRNLFVKTNVVVNEFVGYTGGLVYTGIGSSSGFDRSEYIIVEEETDYTLSGLDNTDGLKMLMWYDENQDPIGSVCFPVTNPGTYTSPTGALFVVFTVRSYIDGSDTTHYNTIQFEKGSIATPYDIPLPVSEYLPLLAERVTDLENESSLVNINKNIVFMGDSITADPTWWTVNMLTRISFTHFRNLANSGATWEHHTDTVYDLTLGGGGSTVPNNVIWNQINKLIDGVDNSSWEIPDVIVIIAGTNSQAGSSNGDIATAFTGAILGLSPGDTLLHTRAGAIRYCIETILAEYPTIQIVLVTPLQRGTADYTDIFARGQIIKDCAGVLSLQTIDWAKEVGVYGYNEVSANIFLYDDLHPNATGNERIGAFMAQKLKNMICV